MFLNGLHLAQIERKETIFRKLYKLITAESEDFHLDPFGLFPGFGMEEKLLAGFATCCTILLTSSFSVSCSSSSLETAPEKHTAALSLQKLQTLFHIFQRFAEGFLDRIHNTVIIGHLDYLFGRGCTIYLTKVWVDEIGEKFHRYLFDIRIGNIALEKKNVVNPYICDRTAPRSLASFRTPVPRLSMNSGFMETVTLLTINAPFLVLLIIKINFL